PREFSHRQLGLLNCLAGCGGDGELRGHPFVPRGAELDSLAAGVGKHQVDRLLRVDPETRLRVSRPQDKVSLALAAEFFRAGDPKQQISIRGTAVEVELAVSVGV